MYPPSNAPALDTRLQSIRKTTLAFASLFTDIPFVTYDQNGKEVERRKVPITYGNKEKYVKRIEASPGEINEKVQITLPRLEYGLVNMDYDKDRKVNLANKIVGCSSDAHAYVKAPMPYNFNFEVVLYTRTIEDANQILEYILPFFMPDYNIKINMVADVGIVRNIPITFSGESEDEDSTGSFDSPVRSVFRTLNFVARSYIYQTPSYYKPILEAITNINIPPSTQDYLLANGSGNFMIGDKVYQGQAYDRASAIGVVDVWNTSSNTLQISTLSGVFVSNTRIYNLRRSAEYNVYRTPSSTLAYSTDITPVPNTYPVIGSYDLDIQIIDNTE